MKTAKKALLLTVCALVLVAATVMGTLAYLTSTDKVVNTFSVGKLAITLDEAKTNDNGDGTVVEGAKRVQANDYKLIPGHHYTKDPTVHLAANSEACYIFIDVDNQLDSVIMEGFYTRPNGEEAEGILDQIGTYGWNNMTNPNTGRTMYYKAVDAADAKAGIDLPVFDYFDVSTRQTYESLKDYQDKTITVTAYACQQDGFAGAAEAWNACFAAKK